MAPARFNVTEEEDYMKRAFVVTLSLIFALTLATASFAQLTNQSAYFMVDSVLGEPGFQGGALVESIGVSQQIGFGVYVKNVDQLRGYEIDVTWDGTKATWRGAYSGTAIEADTININGADTDLTGEANCLGSVAPLGEINEPGHYYINPSKLGGDALVSTEFGLLFIVVLRTTAEFTVGESFDIETDITVLDNGGNKKPLGRRLFHVNSTAVQKDATWGEIKSQFKD